MEKYIIYGIIILCICLFIGLLTSYVKIKKEANKKIKEEIERIKNKKKKEYEELEKNFKEKEEAIKQAFDEKQRIYNESIELTKTIIEEETTKKNLILNQKKEIIERELNEIKIEREYQLQQEFNEKVLEYDKLFDEYKQKKSEETQSIEEEYQRVKNELEEYRKKRETINAAILREKELQEKEEFYKINISENDKKDIEIIKTIESRINNREAINKLIFDVYIFKPMKEMIKRVLGGESPSGIYKITYIPTGECYIGKAVSVDKRWNQHCLSAYGLGTIAKSSLHTKMARDGIWNFSFELLEEVPKENLTEREKYYIKLYDSKKYGLNEREG